jgi:hypothetical protein
MPFAWVPMHAVCKGETQAGSGIYDEIRVGQGL